MRAFGKKNTGKTVGPKKAAGVNSMPPSGKKTGEGGASRAASAWRAVGEAAMSTKHLVSERIKRMSPNTSAEELLFPGNRPDKRRGRSLENARSNGNDAPRVRSASPNRLNCNKCSVSLEAQVKYFCTECKHVYCDKCSSKQQLLPIADERHKPKKQQNKLDICLECSVGGPAEPFLQSPHPVVADVVRFSHPPRRAYSGASRPPPKPCASMNFEFIDLDEIVIDENVSPENIKFGNVGRRESCDHMSLEDLLAGIDEIVSPSKYQSSAAIHHICSIDDTSTHSDDVSAGSRVIRRNPEDTFVMFSPSDDQKDHEDILNAFKFATTSPQTKVLALDLLYSPGQPSDVPIAQTPVVTAARMDRSPSTESVLPHSSSNTEFAALLSEPLTVTLQTIESDVAAPCEAKPAPNTCVDNYPVDTCDTKSPLRLSSPMELTVTVDDSSSITITNSAAKSTIVKSPVVSSAKRHVCENSMSAHSDCTFSSPQLKLTTTFPLVNSEATHTSSSKTVPTEVSVTLFSPEHIIANSGTSVTTPQMNIYRVDPSVLDPLSDQKLTDDTTYDRHSPGCDTSGEAQSEASPTARDAHAGKAHWSAVAQLSLIAEEGDISATQETSPMDEQSNCRIDASAPLGSSKFMFISPPWSQGSKQTTHISASIAAVSSNSSVDSIHPCRFLISPAMNSLEYSGISSLSSHWSASRSSGKKSIAHVAGCMSPATVFSCTEFDSVIKEPSPIIPMDESNDANYAAHKTILSPRMDLFSAQDLKSPLWMTSLKQSDVMGTTAGGVVVTDATVSTNIDRRAGAAGVSRIFAAVIAVLVVVFAALEYYSIGWRDSVLQGACSMQPLMCSNDYWSMETIAARRKASCDIYDRDSSCHPSFSSYNIDNTMDNKRDGIEGDDTSTTSTIVFTMTQTIDGHKRLSIVKQSRADETISAKSSATFFSATYVSTVWDTLREAMLQEILID